MPVDNKFQASNTPFDLTRYDCPYEVERLRILKAIMTPGQGKSAIDIGCGPGYFSRELTTSGWKTLSVDTDSQNIEHTKKHAHKTLTGDALSVLPKLRENQYDLALALEIIEHMPKNLHCQRYAWCKPPKHRASHIPGSDSQRNACAKRCPSRQ